MQKLLSGPLGKNAAWFKANEGDIFTFRQRFNDKHSNIDLNLEALCCKYIFCVDHKDDICDFYNEIIGACLYAGECITTTLAPKHRLCLLGITM